MYLCNCTFRACFQLKQWLHWKVLTCRSCLWQYFLPIVNSQEFMVVLKEGRDEQYVGIFGWDNRMIFTTFYVFLYTIISLTFATAPSYRGPSYYPTTKEYWLPLRSDTVSFKWSTLTTFKSISNGWPYWEGVYQECSIT